MAKEYTIDTALYNALDDAETKDSQGLLIPAMLDDSDYPDGECETIYSIASLYSDDDNDDGTWHDTILDALTKKYPTYQ